MNLSIDQQVIRTYSSHLRFFQLGLQTFLCQLISKIDNKGCSTTISSVGQPVCIVLLLFNLVALSVIKYTKSFSSKAFIVAFVINLGLSSVLMFVGLLGIGQTNSCANNRVLLRLVGFQALVAIIVGLLTFYSKYDFALRYTNAPGNLVWVFLFFAFDWSRHYKPFYIPVAIINLIITISNLSSHLVFLFSNFNPNIKRIIFLVWISSLVGMIIGQIMVFFAYLSSGNDTNSIADVVAKKLAQTFLFVNFVDGIFWTYGLKGLKIQIGDTIHEEAFGIRERDDRNDIC